MRTQLCLFCIIALLVPGYIYAQSAENAIDLKIQDIQYEEPTPMPKESHTDDVLLTGQDALDFATNGFVVKTALKNGLSLNVSKTRTSFDPGTSDSGENSVDISVAADQDYGYQIQTVQQSPLLSRSNVSIGGTTCDSTALPCTPTLARRWTSSSAYGFGYRIFGDDTDRDFHVPTNYRPFPLNSTFQMPVVIMQNKQTMGTRHAQLFLKTIVPPTYQQGTYTGDLSVFLLPKL